MMVGVWGRKVGMTQIFLNDRVIPITVVDVAHWIVTAAKTKKSDGYNAVQVAYVKKKYRNEKFVNNWLKKPKRYFNVMKNIVLKGEISEKIVPGEPINFYSGFSQGNKVDVFGKTKGCGFAGVVKRHNFAGPPGSHGATMGKRPGSIGFITACGKVIKGKKMPGHLGNKQRVMKNLAIIKVEKSAEALFIKGSIPGKAGTFVFVRKA